MVPLTALWLPILLSAVLVFVWSSVVHMLLPFHRGNHVKLPSEDKILEALRGAGVAPGNYMFPHLARPSEMAAPATIEKYNKGPVGMMNVIPNGLPGMGKVLGLWFGYTVLVGLFVAYLTGRALGPGAPYLTVFRFAGTIAFLAYASTHATDPIWKGERWSTALKHMLDGLVYGLLTAGAFGWLWPRG